MLAAVCAIAAPHFDLLSQSWADQMENLTPHSAGSILINVFWPQLAWLIKRTCSTIADLCSRTLDSALMFFVNRVEQLRLRRGDPQHTPHATSAERPFSGDAPDADGEKKASLAEAPCPRTTVTDVPNTFTDSTGTGERKQNVE
ncbi:hypothetical protein [Streptomyces chartreusis]|uniref:hypothetical protein n=1 Tax=Streptomyces chartreusis TaxID=1969 RepID=UPI0034010958